MEYYQYKWRPWGNSEGATRETQKPYEDGVRKTKVRLYQIYMLQIKSVYWKVGCFLLGCMLHVSETSCLTSKSAAPNA